MPFVFNTNNRLSTRWNGSNFVEETLTLTGVDGLNISQDETGFTVSGNETALSGYIDSQDAATLASANSYTDGEIATLSGYTDGEIATLSGYVDSQDAATLASANSYTDTAAANAVTSGQDYADGVAADAVTSGESYTNSVIAALSGYSEGAFVHLTGDETISGNKTFVDNVTVWGDLNVSGTVNQINTEQLLVEDQYIVVNSTVTGTPLVDGGLIVERGESTDAMLIWDEDTDEWLIGLSGSLNIVVDSSDLAALSGALVSGYEAADTALSGDIIDYVDGHQNLLIGGDFGVNPFQYGDSVTLTGVPAYVTDRFFIYTTTSGFVASKDATTYPTEDIYTNQSLKIFIPSGVSISGNNVLTLVQRIEGFRARSLFDEDCNIAFYVKTNVPGKYHVAVNRGNDSYVMPYTVTASGSWERHSLDFNVKTTFTAAEAYGNTTGIGLQIQFVLDADDYFATETPNVWIENNRKLITSGQAKLAETTNNYFNLALVQLVKGKDQGKFLYRSNIEELALCQRYYLDHPLEMHGFIKANEDSCLGVALFPQEMRVTPTVTLKYEGVDGRVFGFNTGNIDGVVAANISTRGFGRVNKNSAFGSDVGVRFGYKASAEL